jgi:hypothetical protein
LIISLLSQTHFYLKKQTYKLIIIPSFIFIKIPPPGARGLAFYFCFCIFNLLFVNCFLKTKYMETLKQPLSNAQLEILKLLSTNLSESELKELKNELAQFYAQKAIQSANQAWREKGLSNEIMEQWLNEDEQ